MKSMATTYLLIAGVLIIWGIIVWKIFSPKDEESYPEMQASKESADNRIDTLMLNYRDPFLGVMQQEETPSCITVSAVENATENTQPIEVTHNLQYMGKIAKNKITYGLIEINGVIHTLRVGDAMDGYKLNSIYEDSVRFIWKGSDVTLKIGAR